MSGNRAISEVGRRGSLRLVGAVGAVGAVVILLAPAALADDEAAIRESLGPRIETPEEASAEEPIRGSAIYGEAEGVGTGFYVRGTTVLPRRTTLRVVLRFRGQQVDARRTIVLGGGFDCVLGPYTERRVFQGDYELEIVFEPHRQPQAVRYAEGVPEEILRVPLEVRVGTDEGAAEEFEERRQVYISHVALLDRLAAELQTQVERAKAKEKFVLGSEKEFDEVAWRRWIQGWRGRLDEELTREIREFQSAGALALAIPDAYIRLSTLAALHQELSKVDNAAEDGNAEGGAILNRGAVMTQIRKARKELNRILGLDDEDAGDGEEGEDPGDGEEGEDPGDGEDGEDARDDGADGDDGGSSEDFEEMGNEPGRGDE